MKYVLMIYQGPTPTLPGSDRWRALPEAEQKACLRTLCCRPMTWPCAPPQRTSGAEHLPWLPKFAAQRWLRMPSKVVRMPPCGRPSTAKPAPFGWRVNQVRTAFLFTVEHGKITGIDLIMDPVHLAALAVKIES